MVQSFFCVRRPCAIVLKAYFLPECNVVRMQLRYPNATLLPERNTVLYECKLITRTQRCYTNATLLPK